MSEQAELTARALERFERVLRDVEHPILDALQPGLPTDVIADAVAATGLRLPDEAAELWRWRNGVDPAYTADRGRIPGSEMFPGNARFLSLEQAVQISSTYQREDYFDVRDDLSPQWFPVADVDGSMIWVDCTGDPLGPAPLIYWYLKDYNPPEELARQTVPSVARGVEVWTALIERGIWRVVKSGDVATFDGRDYVLRDVHPHYAILRPPDEDLPAHWPARW